MAEVPPPSSKQVPPSRDDWTPGGPVGERRPDGGRTPDEDTSGSIRLADEDPDAVNALIEEFEAERPARKLTGFPKMLVSALGLGLSGYAMYWVLNPLPGADLPHDVLGDRARDDLPGLPWLGVGQEGLARARHGAGGGRSAPP